MKYCINCGKEIPDAARFCSVCGTEQDEVDTEIRSHYSNNVNHGGQVSKAYNNPNSIRNLVINRIKKCPYCAEIVNTEATVCKHCNKKLYSSETSASGVDVRKLCISLTILIEAFMIILMFTPLFNIGYSTMFGNSSQISINVFSGFEVADIFASLQYIVDSSTGDQFITTIIVLSLIFLIVLAISIVVFIRYMLRFNGFFMEVPDWNVDNYIPVAPAVFAGMLLILWISANGILHGNNISGMINVSLSLSSIVIILLVVAQFVINIRLNKTEKEEIKTNGWQCSHCGTHNSPNVFYCEFCDRKRNSNKL